MSTTAQAPAATSARPASRDVLDRAVAAQAARRRADVEVLDAALAWAHAHTMSAEDDPDLVAGWRSETIHTPGSAAALFGERPLPIAGDDAAGRGVLRDGAGCGIGPVPRGDARAVG